MFDTWQDSYIPTGEFNYRLVILLPNRIRTVRMDLIGSCQHCRCLDFNGIIASMCVIDHRMGLAATEGLYNVGCSVAVACSGAAAVNTIILGDFIACAVTHDVFRRLTYPSGLRERIPTFLKEVWRRWLLGGDGFLKSRPDFKARRRLRGRGRVYGRVLAGAQRGADDRNVWTRCSSPCRWLFSASVCMQIGYCRREAAVADDSASVADKERKKGRGIKVAASLCTSVKRILQECAAGRAKRGFTRCSRIALSRKREWVTNVILRNCDARSLTWNERRWP